MNGFRLVAAALAVFIAWSLTGCSSAIQMTSAWNDNSIIIDGVDVDWGTSLIPLTDSPLAIGIRNDREFLYVCLSTQDRFTQAQILNEGLTLWFDPKGENDETFGIRYPLRGRFMESSFQELAIVGPKDQEEIFSTLQLKGIQTKIVVSEKGLVYELKLPLRRSAEAPYAIGVSENNVVGIGFQTHEFGSDRIQGPSGRASAGSRGGGRRGGRGGGVAGPDIAGATRPEPINLWAKVVLSFQQQ